MMHRILLMMWLAFILAACDQGETLVPVPDVEPLPVLGGVSVAPEEAILVPGAQETVQLTATVSGVGELDESVTWTSDRPWVAVVSPSGLVTAIDDGIAIVTAASNFDPAGSDSATIRVQRAVVVDVTPAISANLVPIETVLTATFNVAMDPSTIDDTTFTLRTGSLPVAGTVGYDDASRTATLTPEVALEPDTVYEAAISPDVRSASGGTLEWSTGTTEPTRFAWAFWTAPDAGTGPEPTIGGVEVTPATATLVRGVDEPLQLTATLMDVTGDPNRAVTWSSDTPSVATVSAAGEVTAVSVGDATITARSVLDASKSGTARITVEPAPASIGGIEVTPLTATIVVGGAPLQLTATPTGVVGDPDPSVTWSSEAPSVATVSPAGLVTALDAGTATITATSAFDPTVAGTAIVTVDSASTHSLRYAGSPYAYLTGCGERGSTPTCPGDDGEDGNAGAMTPPSDVLVAGATGPLEYSWDGVDTDFWTIDSATGVIFRSDKPHGSNFDEERNGDRVYTVTVRDGSGRSADAAVRFEEDTSD